MRGLLPARFWLLLLIPVVVIFGPALLTRRTFGLRDAGHYYGPLWRYVHAQWQTGVPLWNALEENGRPLAADATSSVFYPAQVLFALPVGFDTAMELYVVGHVLLAMFGVVFAARTFRLSREAASLAALSYGLSGTVVFLHCNPVFLVGAAWFPIGVGLMHRCVAPSPASCGWAGGWSSRRLSLLALGAVFAMMVLGGDPQMAYLLLLVGLIRILVRPPSDSNSRVAQLAILGGAAMIGAVLAAVQILPTQQWARQSDRASYDAPRSLTELIGELARGESLETSGLLDAPRRGSHRAAIYQFSVGPWRWAELLWPNFGGRPFPKNQRWIAAIPAEGRYWTPTLYMGLVPILLALMAMGRSARSHPMRRWCIVCAVLFSVASLGRYGIVWAISEMRAAFGVDPPEGWGPIGGLYWLMTITLPGFVLFRYPAKLWIAVVLSLSLLAARQADHVARHDSRGLRRILVGYLVLSVIPLLGAVITVAWPDWLAVPSDVIYGPFDIDGATWGVVVTVLHGLVIAAAVWWISRWKESSGSVLIRWLVVATAVDLTVAHFWLVPTVASPSDASPGFAITSPSDGQSAQWPPRYLRWKIDHWYPQRWSIDADSHRIAQLVEWDRRTLRPKYNLDATMNVLQSYTSSTSARHRAMLDLLYERSEDRSHSFYRLIDVLGTQYVISPADQIHRRHFALHAVVENPDAVRQNVYVWRNERAFPNAWIVHKSRPVAPARSKRWKDQRQYMRRALLEPAELLRQEVVLDERVDLESDTATEAAHVPLSDAPEYCRMIRQLGGEMVLEAKLNRAGFVVISSSYDPGWTCTLDSHTGTRSTTPVMRANGLMCAVALSRGQHRLTLRYRPTSFFLGATISALSWIVWFALIWAAWRRPRIPRP